ncbi:hypothetical protein [Brachybacterium saurashtrense]|uniref:DUF4190 domain-containing protein n=1 Tax=Brachybacterium saurashtrense TaxID=556288 RepID=A0A345YMB5_9MICO|nr:hypothetical protein [Brachybacterium saurashtrense]AXK45067.1 hypothetical protein DWV08_05175 [Brachybacterium saurashtrense]RRR21751.1 hypothetical protein DXU92_13750 [Brachybacterium saurashtrense]
MSLPPPAPLPDRSSLQTRAILLIVFGFLCGGTVPAIFGIIALVQMDSDPYSAQKMNKIGWIIFWVMLGLAVLAILAYIAFFGVTFLLLGTTAMQAPTGG